MLTDVLPPNDPVEFVLDTDTYNELDDVYALIYALRSAPRLKLAAVYAAPFHNHRSKGPADGMQRSFEEIHRVMPWAQVEGLPPVFRGAKEWFDPRGQPALTEAAKDLIERARSRQADQPPLYVVGIAALTNVACALFHAPDIATKIALLWLGGHPPYWPSAQEFNLKGDLAASRFIFDSEVPLVHFPCGHVAVQLRTTLAEMERFLSPQTTPGCHLLKMYQDFETLDLKGLAMSKPIWDLAPVAWLVNPEWFQTKASPRPSISADITWCLDSGGPNYLHAFSVQRDPVFADFFRKVSGIEGL
jgi:inosine-uridine nucleoside N-ribohydrolase